MRKTVAIVAGIAILVLVNWTVFQRERLLTNGRTVLLELAPADPRSLMQGDYMALRFKLADQVFGRGLAREVADGRIVVSVGEHGVGSFVRHDAGELLASGEVRMRYRVREGRVKFATNAYFFQEGTAGAYARARYGEFRVAADGDMLLTHLVSEQFKRLGPVARY
ncbi:MAG: GDYXXLXY domain-containing protein [Burkholderiales bacterium]|nr:GDYXXLXY domain-containing protein [Burkholderiales bacterium]